MKENADNEVRIGPVLIGPLPRVVGTVSTQTAFERLASSTSPISADIVELRLDEMGGAWNDERVSLCKRVQAKGVPILVTIRSALEGGKWTGSDSDRFAILEQAGSSAAALDIELNSSIAREASQLTRSIGIPLIASFHDFQGTPSQSFLRDLIERAHGIGSIAKVAAMIHSEPDAELLSGLLDEAREKPVCVIGMGNIGTRTRVEFARAGSALTYGYLDEPSAPGQLSASELTEQLSVLMPEYRNDRLSRHAS